MKKIFIYSIMLAGCLLYTSCHDLFNKTNLEAIGSDRVWEDEQLLEAYINNLYATYPTWSGDESDLSDEGRNGYPGTGSWRVIRGEWGVDFNPCGIWDYVYVRKCNEILKYTPDSPIDERLKMRFLGEATFFRATIYLLMAVRYGGVPLITEPQGFDAEDLYPKRASIDEIFSFITSEYEKAAEYLEDFKTYEDSNWGRVTWGACKAMNARTYLYWASPLYNETNDSNLWNKAAELCQEVIQSGLYSLLPDVRDLYLDKKSTETIFALYYKKPEKTHGVDSWCKPLSIANNNAAHWSPTQELVDAFPTINGLSIDEDPVYNPQNPYQNRDPRLSKFIVVNGSEYCGRTQFTYYDIGEVHPSVSDEEVDKLRSYESGGLHFDCMGSGHNSPTGYLCRKPIQEDLPIYEYNGSSGSETPYIEIRLGEVILNLAEALNEAGDINGACSELEKIRARAGLLNPAVPLNNRNDKESLRKFIQNERHIELCFEQKRYWDLKRWKIAESRLNGKQFSRMEIYLNILDNTHIINTPEYQDASFHEKVNMLNKSWTYRISEADDNPYIFLPKMYFMPIPRSEMETNPNLVQNKDW